MRDGVSVNNIDINLDILVQEGIASLLTQSDRGVPSSANWNPTKPFNIRDQQRVHMTPVCTAANHYIR